MADSDFDDEVIDAADDDLVDIDAPDNPLGLYLHLNGWGLTAGQCLSLPMVAVGLWFVLGSRRTSTA